MPVDRAVYKNDFHQECPPQFKCPTCNKGVIKIKKDSFLFKESKASYDEHSNENWDYEWIEYVYSCCFVCTNPACKDLIMSVGVGSVDVDYNRCDEYGVPSGREWRDYFKPKFFQPHLKIFDVAKNTPEDIQLSINESFKLFFSSPSSSANHIRISLEKILNFLKIKRFEIKKGKRVPISLHRRINLLSDKYSNIRDLILAIKWLGNAGSHLGDITMDDVMDVYDILEIVLNDLFDSHLEKTKKMAKKINKKKGRVNKL